MLSDQEVTEMDRLDATRRMNLVSTPSGAVYGTAGEMSFVSMAHLEQVGPGTRG
jgi:hypothetical protein